MTPSKGRVVELQLPVIVRHRRLYPGRGQRQHPANVGRRDEVPGRTQYMRAENRPIAHCPLDCRIDDPTGGEGKCQELLIGESPACDIDIKASHGVAVRITASRSCEARLRHSFFKASLSAARDLPRKQSVVISNAGSSFLAEVLEYTAITPLASNLEKAYVG